MFFFLITFDYRSNPFFIRYQFDRKCSSQVESLTFSWWGRFQTMLRSIVFHVPLSDFSLLNFEPRYDSELDIGFITKIVPSFLLDYFFDLRAVDPLSFNPSFHTTDVVTIILFIEGIGSEMHNFVFDFSWVCPNVRQVFPNHAFRVRLIMSKIHTSDLLSRPIHLGFFSP